MHRKNLKKFIRSETRITSANVMDFSFKKLKNPKLQTPTILLTDILFEDFTSTDHLWIRANPNWTSEKDLRIGCVIALTVHLGVYRSRGYEKKSIGAVSCKDLKVIWSDPKEMSFFEFLCITKKRIILPTDFITNLRMECFNSHEIEHQANDPR